MTGALTVDRICLVVRDLDAAARRFTALGFTLTPESRHMIGSRNRCVMLRDGQYLELLDPRASVSHPGNTAYQQHLSEYGEGLAVLSLRCDDPGTVARAWQRAGLEPSPMRYFSRKVDLATGVAEAHFELVQLTLPPLPGAPGLAVSACHHLTPDLVWRPDCLDHVNGASGVSRIELHSTAPEQDAIVLAQLAMAPAPTKDAPAEVHLGAGLCVHFHSEPSDAIRLRFSPTRTPVVAYGLEIALENTDD